MGKGKKNAGYSRKKKLSPVRKIVIASIFVVIVAIVQHFGLGWLGVEARQELRMADTGTEIFYGFDMRANFYSPGARHFYFAARDGVQSISYAGDIRWQHGFNMSLPVMVGRGDIVAVGEPGGRRIYVFGPSGYLYTANLPYPILYYTVNGSGYLAVIIQTDIGHEIRVFHYDNPSDLEYIYKAPVHEANVFPFSVDVSECGTYIVKAFLDVDTLIFSRLTFSYVRRADSRGVPDGLFASYDFHDEFIIRARFTRCGRAIVITDRQILGYLAGEATQGPAWSIPLYNRPDKIYIGSNGFAYVTGDPFLNQPDAINPGVLHIYNFQGNLTGTYNLDRRATHLSMAHNAALVGMGRTFYAINQNGTRLWDYTAIQDVQSMIFLDNTDTVLQSGGIKATVMRRQRVNE